MSKSARPGQTRLVIWVRTEQLDFLKAAHSHSGILAFAEWVRSTLRSAAEAQLGRIATRRIDQRKRQRNWAAQFMQEQALAALEATEPDAPDGPDTPDIDAAAGDIDAQARWDEAQAQIMEHGTFDHPK